MPHLHTAFHNVCSKVPKPPSYAEGTPDVVLGQVAAVVGPEECGGASSHSCDLWGEIQIKQDCINSDIIASFYCILFHISFMPYKNAAKTAKSFKSRLTYNL